MGYDHAQFAIGVVLLLFVVCICGPAILFDNAVQKRRERIEAARLQSLVAHQRENERANRDMVRRFQAEDEQG